MKRLGEIATYINGKAFKPAEWSGKGLPIIRIQNLTNPDKPYNYYNGKLKEKYLVKDGDILISWSASLGLFEWKGEDAALNQHIFKVLFDRDVELDRNYFKHIITLSLQKMADLTHGATMKHITKKKFDNFQIPLPPLPIQRQIAELLDTADALRRRTAEQLALLDELAQSVFLELFGDPVLNEKGWEVVPFGDNVIEIVGGKSYGGSDREIKDSELGVLKISAVTSGDFQLRYKVVEEIEDISSLVFPEIGDLLFSRANTRELVAATCIVNQKCDQFFLPDKLWKIVLNPKIADNHFVKFTFSHPGFRREITKFATGTSGSMLNISKTKLRKIPIPIPPIGVQGSFKEIIENIEAQKQQVRAALQESEDLFQCLLQEVFG